MLTKIIAASVLTIGMATAAVAQQSSNTSGQPSATSSTATGSGQTVTPDPADKANPSTIDPSSTESTTGMTSGTTAPDPSKMNSENCPNTANGSDTAASPKLNQAEADAAGNNCM